MRERCVTRRPGRPADWGPRREERVMVGWSASREVMKVRHGDRNWEELLGPRLLRGGEPQAKLSEVGRGRGVYASLAVEWGPRGPRASVFSCA